LVVIEFNGKLYARVSEIIRPFTDFGHIDPCVLANKARLGTSVHQAIADYINGDFPSPDPDGVGYFESFLKWEERLNPQFIASEKRYFCEQKMITGQIDCLIHMPGPSDVPKLVDFKTSAQESKETWPMQAHLYHYLLTQNKIDVSHRFLFIKLNKVGDIPEVFEYKFCMNTKAKCMNAIENFWKTT
jgi:hypothetical protein